MAIVVKISRRTAEPAAFQIYSRCQRYIREPAVAEVVQQAARSIRHPTDEEKIWFAITVVVKEAGARARPDRSALTAPGLRDKRIRLRRKSHRNRRRDINNRAPRQFRERISPLIPITCAKRHSKMLRRDFETAPDVPALKQYRLFAVRPAPIRTLTKRDKDREPAPSETPQWLRHIFETECSGNRENSRRPLRSSAPQRAGKPRFLFPSLPNLCRPAPGCTRRKDPSEAAAPPLRAPPARAPASADPATRCLDSAAPLQISDLLPAPVRNIFVRPPDAAGSYTPRPAY